MQIETEKNKELPTSKPHFDPPLGRGWAHGGIRKKSGKAILHDEWINSWYILIFLIIRMIYQYTLYVQGKFSVCLSIVYYIDEHLNWNWRRRCPNKLSNWWTNSGDLLKVNFWVITFFVRNFCKNVSPNLFRLNFQYVKDVIHPKFYPHYILSCPLSQYTLS